MTGSGEPTKSTKCVEKKRHDNSVSILVVIKNDLTVYHPKQLELFYLSIEIYRTNKFLNTFTETDFHSLLQNRSKNKGEVT